MDQILSLPYPYLHQHSDTNIDTDIDRCEKNDFHIRVEGGFECGYPE